MVHRYLRFTAGSKDVVNPCELIWTWTTQATMTNAGDAMRGGSVRALLLF